MTFAKCNAQSVARIHNNANVIVVGINPDLWYKEGKLIIAGPVNELTAIDMLPNIPMVPFEIER